MADNVIDRLEVFGTRARMLVGYDEKVGRRRSEIRWQSLGGRGTGSGDGIQ